VYALDESGEFLWSARYFDKNRETGEITYKPMPNKNPFISMEARGQFSIMALDEVETDTTEHGYYIGVNSGGIATMDLQLLRSQHRERIEEERRQVEKKEEL